MGRVYGTGGADTLADGAEADLLYGYDPDGADPAPMTVGATLVAESASPRAVQAVAPSATARTSTSRTRTA